METLFWTVSAEKPEQDIIKQAAGIIRRGGLVAFPTETVYGLGADGLNPAAVRRIFAAKGRPSDNPLILHVARQEEVFRLAAEVKEQAQELMRRFWPGPLTLVLPKAACIPDEVTAGLDTVAVRMPRHPVALALIAAAGVPIAAPSANRSGYPSPTTGQHVYGDLAGRIEAVLESGPTGVGLESTVLDLSGDVPAILRPGGITREELAAVLGTVLIDPGLLDPRQKPKAPGMKYTHYAPRAAVYLLSGPSRERKALKIQELVWESARKGEKVGLLLTSETWQCLRDLPACPERQDSPRGLDAQHLPADNPLPTRTHCVAGQDGLPENVAYARDLGSRSHLEEIAHVLYGELRNCDAAQVDLIYTETYQEEGLGAALMNRLLKSAGYKVINT